VYEYIRYPQSFAELEHSIKRYLQRLQPDYFTVVMTVSALNVLNIAELMEWANDLYPCVHIWFAEVFPQKRGTSLYHLPVDLLAQAQQRIQAYLDQPNSNLADQLQRIQQAIDHNQSDQQKLREEVLLFDQARDQSYRDHLDPLLITWLDQC